MFKDYKIRAPFFEFGPKAYLYGKQLLELVKAMDDYAIEFDVDVVIDPQTTDINLLANNTKRVHIYGQHMDTIKPGRGMGTILPEALKEAGAIGVLPNHAEHKMTLKDVELAIQRADEVGLATMVCTDTLEEMKAVAGLAPNIIVAEPTALIGTGQPSSMDYVLDSINTIKAINPDIMVLQGAGISNGQDVYNVIRAGAEATGSSSGIVKAPDQAAMAREMIAAVRQAWNDRLAEQ